MGPRSSASCLIVLSCLTGCTISGLTRHTVEQTNTITDIQYRQVVQNLAMIAHDPRLLPSFSLIAAGNCELTDTLQMQGDLSLNKSAAGIFSVAGDADLFNAKRQLAQNWAHFPVVAPEKLRALRMVYRYAITSEPFFGPDRDVWLTGFTFQEPSGCSSCNFPRGYYFNVADDLLRIPKGWLKTGCRRQVPKNARYQANCGDTYVWVCSDGMNGLSELTIITIRIAWVNIERCRYPLLLQPVTERCRFNGDVIDCSKGAVVHNCPIDATVSFTTDCCGNVGPFKAREENVPAEAIGKLKAEIANAKGG